MKISKAAPELLKKAAAAVKSKTSAIKARLIFIASLRRRMAMVGMISHKIHALMSEREKARVAGYGKALTAGEKTAAYGTIDLSELAVFQEDDEHCPDWSHSLFDDHKDKHDDDHNALDALDEPSVIDMIRSNREVEGFEFNIEDDIDQAADMFIKRIRKQMNRSF